MDDRKTANEQAAESKDLVSRRKLVYAAPLLMSKRLFYRAAGCGKINPLQKSCIGGASQGS